LESAGCADAEECRHPETEIERAGMHQQPLEYILMPTHVLAPEATGLIEMRTRSLQQFAALAKEPFPAVAADTPSIHLDSAAFYLLIGPRLRLAIGFANIGANLQRL
jgi:hypothetical protein